jgi:hypothetical protein
MRSFLAGLFLLSIAGAAHAGRCGPFDIFEGNDYCVSCQNGTRKVYACPGGEAGMVAVGVANPGCSVSYFGSSCRVTRAFRYTKAQTKSK